MDVASLPESAKFPLGASLFNKLNRSLLAVKRWAQFAWVFCCPLVPQPSLLNLLPGDKNGFVLANFLASSGLITVGSQASSFLKVDHGLSRCTREAELYMEGVLAYEDCDRFRAASGDLCTPFDTDWGTPDPRRTLPGACQRNRWCAVRGPQKRERHPAAWGHDVRFGPN